METISGINNWKLVVRREAEGVTILRAVTCDAKAALPDTLFGLPVTVLGGFLYHMIFEAKSQYIFVYAMYLIPLAALGLAVLSDGLSRAVRRFRKS